MLGIAAGDVRCGCNLSVGDDEVVFGMPVQQQERSASGKWVIASEQRGRWVGWASEADYFERGQAVAMAFSLARAYWFDSTTGRTLVAPT